MFRWLRRLLERVKKKIIRMYIQRKINKITDEAEAITGYNMDECLETLRDGGDSE